MSGLEIGSNSDWCFAMIGLHGIDGQKRPLGYLTSKADVRLWLSGHEDSWIDPTRWKAIVLSTSHYQTHIVTTMLSAEDWNIGKRWDGLDDWLRT